MGTINDNRLYALIIPNLYASKLVCTNLASNSVYNNGKWLAVEWAKRFLFRQNGRKLVRIDFH